MERYTIRENPRRLELTVTLTDPVTFTKPLVVTKPAVVSPVAKPDLAQLDAEAFAAALRDAPLKPGASGAVVEWISRRLHPAYLATSGAPAVFDAAMQDAVRRFQRDAGLSADGVVGPATLMALAAHEAPVRTAALESDTGAQ